MAVVPESTELRRTAGSLAGGVPGALIGALFGVAAQLRATKPLHPRGQMGAGTLRVTDPVPHLGVPVLSSTGCHPCTVRWSRSVGLPTPLPDIDGLALRFEDTGADLLFASTGRGAVTRFLLAPRVPGRRGPLTTLLPVSSEAGPLVFMVEPVDASAPPTRFAVSVAQGSAAWRRAGTLDVEWGADRPCRFDPLLNQVPGTTQYPLVRALREPAYVQARRRTDATG